MKTFKNHSIIILMAQIIHWCLENKQMPKRIEFSIEDKSHTYPHFRSGEHVAILNYYPEKAKPVKPSFLEAIQKTTFDGLTEAERAYANHLKSQNTIDNEARLLRIIKEGSLTDTDN